MRLELGEWKESDGRFHVGLVSEGDYGGSSRGGKGERERGRQRVLA